MMTKFKHIIFDFDGTLADTSRIILSTMQATMRQKGLRIASPRAIRRVVGFPLKECFTHIYPGISEKDALECTHIYNEIFNSYKSSLTPTLFPQVSETLDTLDQHGITMSVASSRCHKSLIELLELLKVRHHFAMIVVVDNVDKAKPDPEVILYTLKAMAIDANDAIMVGDMPVDVATGQNAGVKTCAVTYGNSPKKDLKKSHPDYLIDNFNQLLKIL